MDIKLSILIPTVIGREQELDYLLSKISKYAPLDIKANLKNNEFGYIGTKYDLEDVEVIVVCDNKQNTIGGKREFLYSIANGEYSWQIDDDDDIAPNAIEKILAAIDNNPDVISFQERVVINGVEYKSNFSSLYADWDGDGNSILFDGFHFQRTIFYKCVIKTELARKVPFKRIRFGEDHEFAKDLKPLIDTDFHINEQIYYYTHNSKPEEHNERYGIKD
jgi:hypothetical protein